MLITPDVLNLIDSALTEDVSMGDPTTDILIDGDLSGRAEMTAREPGVLAGIEVAAAVFRRLDSSLEVETVTEDGSSVAPGDRLAAVTGCVASMLKAERTALNFVQRLSGIATETRRYVEAVEGWTLGSLIPARPRPDSASWRSTRSPWAADRTIAETLRTAY